MKAWGFRNEWTARRPTDFHAEPLSRTPNPIVPGPTRSQAVSPTGGHEVLQARMPEHASEVHPKIMPSKSQIATAYFATHGSLGILDLGASKTVMGSDQEAELIQSLV